MAIYLFFPKREGRLYGNENWRNWKDKNCLHFLKEQEWGGTVYFLGDRFKPQKGNSCFPYIYKLWNLLCLGMGFDSKLTNVYRKQMIKYGSTIFTPPPKQKKKEKKRKWPQTVGMERTYEEWSFIFFLSTYTADCIKGSIWSWITQYICYYVLILFYSQRSRVVSCDRQF